jgi:hypothetical protein
MTQSGHLPLPAVLFDLARERLKGQANQCQLGKMAEEHPKHSAL